MSIHPSALIDPKAELDSSVEVGPFAIIGPNVKIGAGTKIGSYCQVEGYTTIGQNNHFYAYCSVGGQPQDKKYAGEPTQLIIGDGNKVREFCTLNTGTTQDDGITSIANNNWIMAYVHVAHDCKVGSNTIIANSTQLAGHVHIGDWVILGGFTGIHQFVRVGAHAMTGIASKLMQDVPPFVMAAGSPTAPHGINSEGLKRRGFSSDAIMRIKRAYKAMYREGLSLDETRQKLLADIANGGEGAEHVQLWVDFINSASRGILR